MLVYKAMAKCLKFCIIKESNFQNNFFPIVLYSNMAAVTSRENRESRRSKSYSRGKYLNSNDPWTAYSDWLSSACIYVLFTLLVEIFLSLSSTEFVPKSERKSKMVVHSVVFQDDLSVREQ